MSMTATLVKSGHTKLAEPGLHLGEVARPRLSVNWRRHAECQKDGDCRQHAHDLSVPVCSKEDHLDGNKEYPLVVALGCHRCGQMVKAVPRSCCLGHANRETGLLG
jgi:hypothetical protein